MATSHDKAGDVRPQDEFVEQAHAQEAGDRPQPHHEHHHHHHHHHHKELEVVPIEQEAHENDVHVDLGWRSWVVVAICSFAVLAQVFVVVASGSVIAFIRRDMGNSPLIGWVIQGPLLMQSVLSPIMGRLSDILDRKYLASVPPMIAFAGAVVSAKATSVEMLIVGGILIGTTLSSIAIVHAIPSEILPLKYRALANATGFLGGAFGGLAGGLGAGAVTALSPDGWRYIYWIQAGLHAVNALGLLAFYWPPKNTEIPKMTLMEYVWACDPIGSGLFISSTTLMLLALDWAGGAYEWSDPHVAAPLGVGLGLLVCFFLYEWKGRTDGLAAHVFFRNNFNFALSTFAFAVEGWIFYSAVNSIVPQVILHLGFETDPWKISIRQLSYQITTIVMALPLTWYATKYKDLKSPLVVTFTIFFAVCICYATIKPSWNVPQIVITVLCAIGQSGPLTLLVACIQFSSPHAFLSTATGLAFSARAIGGAFGSAVLDAIINGRLSGHHDPAVSAAARAAGLAADQVPALLAAIKAGKGPAAGVAGEVWKAATEASHWEYARAYRLAWASIIPFVAVATVAVASMRGVKELMTEKVEATLERVPVEERNEKLAV